MHYPDTLLQCDERCRRHLEMRIVQVFVDDSDVKFYDTNQVQIVAFKAKPITFDLVFSVMILGYFAALLVGLLGFSQVIVELKGLFASGSKAHSKKTR